MHKLKVQNGLTNNLPNGYIYYIIKRYKMTDEEEHGEKNNYNY